MEAVPLFRKVGAVKTNKAGPAGAAGRTELDHSSVASLVAGLEKYRGCVFRFKYESGGVSPQWRLKKALVGTAAMVSLFIEFGSVRDDGVWVVAAAVPVPGWPSLYVYRQDRGDIYAAGIWMKVVVENAPPQSGGSSSADDSLRRRLDGNLRGVFS